MLNMLDGVGSLVKLTPLKVRENIPGGNFLTSKWEQVKAEPWAPREKYGAGSG